MKPGKALLIVDMQNDFCPGGALAVSEGDKIVPVLNQYIQIFSEAGLPIFASRDWHPKETRHFKEFGGAWPVHCLQHSEGAKFHPKLELPKDAVLLSKGMGPEEDSYSAFQAKDEKGSGFGELLKRKGIKELYIGGLATDYCVKFCAIDALKSGFKVKLLIDAIKGVDINKGDSERAIKEILDYGAQGITLGEAA